MRIYASDYFVIEHAADPQIWVFRRTDRAFESAKDVRAEIARLDNKLSEHEPRHCGALIDLREARGRNDPDMEAELRRIRLLFHAHFTAVANLLRSAVGVLHLKRLLRQDGLQEAVYRDEAEALAWLRSQLK